MVEIDIIRLFSTKSLDHNRTIKFMMQRRVTPEHRTHVPGYLTNS